MALRLLISLLYVLLFALTSPLQAISNNQSEFFSLLKTSLTGNGLPDWDVDGGKPFCNFTGITCNPQGYVEEFDISWRRIYVRFPAGICSYLPQLRVIQLGHNHLHDSDFLNSVVNNCSFLEELDMGALFLIGKLPDFSPLRHLKVLNMSYNFFTGEFPLSVTNLTNLELLDFNENTHLDSWQLPESFTRLTKLKTMILTTCAVRGQIPAWLGNMTSLVDLELSGIS